MEHQEDIVNKIDQYVAGFEVPFARSDITEMKDWLFGQLSSSQQSSVSANDACGFFQSLEEVVVVVYSRHLCFTVCRSFCQ